MNESEKIEFTNLFIEQSEEEGLFSEWEKFNLIVWPIHDLDLMKKKVADLWNSWCEKNEIEGKNPNYKSYKEKFYQGIVERLEKLSTDQDTIEDHVNIIQFFKSELSAFKRRKTAVSVSEVFKLDNNEFEKLQPLIIEKIELNSLPREIAKLCIALDQLGLVDLGNVSNLTRILNSLSDNEIKLRSLADAIKKGQDRINSKSRSYDTSYNSKVTDIISEIQSLFKNS